MKKGINKEYDEARNKLFELRYKIQLLKMKSDSQKELEITLNELLLCQKQLKQIEMNTIKGTK